MVARPADAARARETTVRTSVTLSRRKDADRTLLKQDGLALLGKPIVASAPAPKPPPDTTPATTAASRKARLPDTAGEYTKVQPPF